MMLRTDDSRRCSRCETLPEKISGPGRLFLWFPLGHSFNKVVGFLGQSSLDFQILGDCVALSLAGDQIQSVVTALIGLMTGKEGEETRALYMEGPQEPGLSDFPRVISLRRFVAGCRSALLVDVLKEKRLTSYFHPIVKVEDTSQIYAQEALLRAFDKDGSPISPKVLFDLARDADLLFQLDVAARLSAIREAARYQIKTCVFVNFTPLSIFDPTYCLRTTINLNPA